MRWALVHATKTATQENSYIRYRRMSWPEITINSQTLKYQVDGSFTSSLLYSGHLWELSVCTLEKETTNSEHDAA